MKICVDISPAVHGRAGLGRYSAELITALVDLDKDNEYMDFYNRPHSARIPPSLSDLPRRTVALGDKPWRMMTLLAHVAGSHQDRLFGAVDIFHATDNVLPSFDQIRSVFTLHDLIFRRYPASHTRLNRWYLTMMMPRFLRRADHIIAPSRSTANDAMDHYDIPKEQISIIPDGVSASFCPVTDVSVLEQVRARYVLPERFFLYVGTIEPRKNLQRVIRAFAASGLEEVRLIIAGKKGWMFRETFDLVHRLGMDQRVHFLGFVPDVHLPALNSMALAFVFPSLYEGFGLPVLEAMACGVPVITSAVSSLPEVTGEAAILVNPSEQDEITAAMRLVADDAPLRQKLREKGLVQAARFSWRRTAEETLEVYRRVHLGEGSG